AKREIPFPHSLPALANAALGQVGFSPETWRDLEFSPMPLGRAGNGCKRGFAMTRLEIRREGFPRCRVKSSSEIPHQDSTTGAQP
ncbi:MAG: hypothetical protein OXF43_04465, partial [Gammaproteobacteria bacterium]|nr:hypothetical protein [Gammaproteobacteria bacterium]